MLETKPASKNKKRKETDLKEPLFLFSFASAFFFSLSKILDLFFLFQSIRDLTKSPYQIDHPPSGNLKQKQKRKQERKTEEKEKKKKLKTKKIKRQRFQDSCFLFCRLKGKDVFVFLFFFFSEPNPKVFFFCVVQFFCCSFPFRPYALSTFFLFFLSCVLLPNILCKLPNTSVSILSACPCSCQPCWTIQEPI